MKYLLDTNVLSEPLKPSPDPAILARLQQMCRRHFAECSLGEDLLRQFIR